MASNMYTTLQRNDRDSIRIRHVTLEEGTSVLAVQLNCVGSDVASIHKDAMPVILFEVRSLLLLGIAKKCYDHINKLLLSSGVPQTVLFAMTFPIGTSVHHYNGLV